MKKNTTAKPPVSSKEIILIVLTIIAFGAAGYFLISLFTDNSIIRFVGALFISFIPEKVLYKKQFEQLKAAANESKKKGRK